MIRPGLNDDFTVAPGGSAPLFISANYQAVSDPLVFTTFIDRLGKPEKDGESWQTPHCDVPVYADANTIPDTLPAFEPVSLDCIVKEVLTPGVLTDETKAVIATVRKIAVTAGHPLPVATVDMMARFIAATQNEFKGGVAEAIDRALCLYVAAHILDCGLEAEGFKPHLAAMPRTLKALKA